MLRSAHKILLLFSLLLGCVGLNYVQAGVIASGNIGASGSSVTWTLDSDSVLTISGTGDIANYPIIQAPFHKTMIIGGVTTRAGLRVKTIVIESGVTSIGTNAFYGCNKVTDIYVSWTSAIPAWNSMTTHSPQSDITLHVPCAAVDLYKDATGWKGYTISGNNIASGTCGTLASWSLACDSTLRISGTGIMNNYGTSTSMPWNAYKSAIKSVFVTPGITSIGDYAFYGCLNLISITFPSTVTTIRTNAFRYCTSLTSVTIPSNVTLIGNNAFENTGLTDIYVSWTTAEAIPTWNSISQTDDVFLHVPCGTAAYYLAKNGWKNYQIRGGCSTTYTLTIASGNSTMGLVQIDKGTPAASIVEQVYTDDSHRITALPVDACHHFVQWNDGNTDNPRTVMPNTNTTYTATFAEGQHSGPCGVNLTWVLECDSTLRISGTGEMANYSSSSPWKKLVNVVKHVVIEEGVTTIGDYAFYQMKNIVTVTNPSTLQLIGTCAFHSCYSLESINFPDGLTSIGRNTTGHGPFYGCHSLQSIHIPASVTMINRDAFLRCYSATSIVVDPANTVYDSRANCNAIIETATKKLLYGCQTTVIPDGVLTVSQYAFEYQHNLKSIRISNTVTSFGSYVFKECENLKDIYVEWTTTPPANVLTSWSEHPNLDATITVHVPCGYASLYTSESAWNRYNIEDDHLAGGTCGAQGSNLTWMLSCDGQLEIKGVGEMADWSAQSDVPWKSYRNYITSVVTADGVTSIAPFAFYDCTSLTSISIPEGVTSIGRYALNNCPSLAAVSIPSSVNSIGIYAFYKCSSLPSISIPEGVTSIATSTFNRCSSLSSVTIPNSVTSIGFTAFDYCSSLTSVTIPNSVTNIGYYAFGDCNLLTDIYVSWTENIPTWTNMTNNDPQTDVTLHVPCPAVDLYQEADGWKGYTLETEGGPYTVTVQTATGDTSQGGVSITTVAP